MLASRFEVDALPEAGRAYDRVVEDETTDSKTDGKKDDGKDAKGSGERVVKATPNSPAPDLFYQKTSGVAPTAGDSDDDSSDDSDSKEKAKPKKGFFGKLFGS